MNLKARSKDPRRQEHLLWTWGGFSQFSDVAGDQTPSTRLSGGEIRREYDMIICSPREDTNHCLQIGSATSLPNQERQDMATSCTQEVPGKGPLSRLEGR